MLIGGSAFIGINWRGRCDWYIGIIWRSGWGRYRNCCRSQRGRHYRPVLLLLLLATCIVVWLVPTIYHHVFLVNTCINIAVISPIVAAARHEERHDQHPKQCRQKDESPNYIGIDPISNVGWTCSIAIASTVTVPSHATIIIIVHFTIQSPSDADP